MFCTLDNYSLVSNKRGTRTLKNMHFFAKKAYYSLVSYIRGKMAIGSKILKIFNKVQDIWPFEALVTTGHVYEKYGPRSYF